MYVYVKGQKIVLKFETIKDLVYILNIRKKD